MRVIILMFSWISYLGCSQIPENILINFLYIIRRRKPSVILLKVLFSSFPLTFLIVSVKQKSTFWIAFHCFINHKLCLISILHWPSPVTYWTKFIFTKIRLIKFLCTVLLFDKFQNLCTLIDPFKRTITQFFKRPASSIFSTCVLATFYLCLVLNSP